MTTYIANNITPNISATFSSNALWKYFEVEKCHLKQTRLTVESPGSHTLLFNTGAPVSFMSDTGQGWKRYVCNKGQVVTLASMDRNLEIVLEQECNLLKISFDAGFTNIFLGTSDFRFSTVCNINDVLLSSTLSKLDESINKNYVSEKMYIESLLMSCFVHLICNYPADGKRIFAPKAKLSAQQLNHVIEFTRTAIHTNINLSQLASCVHLSAFHFARLFRNTMGISPYQYVLHAKIEYSIKLIRQNARSLSDVAFALNFTDQAHFSNAFKKVTGVCPREFIQSNRLKISPEVLADSEN